MRFMGRHGYYEHELEHPQPFEVDVELVLNLQPAGVDDDLTRTIDYGRVYDIVRQVVESTSFRLLEADDRLEPAVGIEADGEAAGGFRLIRDLGVAAAHGKSPENGHGLGEVRSLRETCRLRRWRARW